MYDAHSNALLDGRQTKGASQVGHVVPGLGLVVAKFQSLKMAWAWRITSVHYDKDDGPTVEVEDQEEDIESYEKAVKRGKAKLQTLELDLLLDQIEKGEKAYSLTIWTLKANCWEPFKDIDY